MARPDIAAIKERAAAATPGPWRFRTEEGYDDSSHWWTAWVEAEDGKEIIGHTDDPWDNGEFIAAARTDIPALLAYVAELEQQIAAHDHEWAVDHPVSKLSIEGVPRGVDNETGIDPFAGRRYTWKESKEIPPPGYRYEERDDDPGHPASRSYWVLVRRVS